MIGLTAFLIIALLGAAFMLYVLAKFQKELKPAKRTSQRQRESETGEWRILSPFAQGTTGFAAPAINPEQIVIIETPYCGPIPLIRTVISLSPRSNGGEVNHGNSAPQSGRREVLNFRKRPPAQVRSLLRR
jgi:hypothetical protein